MSGGQWRRSWDRGNKAIAGCVQPGAAPCNRVQRHEAPRNRTCGLRRTKPARVIRVPLESRAGTASKFARETRSDEREDQVETVSLEHQRRGSNPLLRPF